MRYNVRDERGRFVKKAAKKCTKKKCCSKKPPIDSCADKLKCVSGTEGPARLTVEEEKIIKQVLDILDDYLKELDNKEQLIDAFRKYMLSTKVPVDVPLPYKVSWQVDESPVEKVLNMLGIGRSWSPPLNQSVPYCEVKFK